MREGFGDHFTLLVLQVRVIAGSFFLGESSCFSKTLFVTTLDDISDTLWEV